MNPRSLRSRTILPIVDVDKGDDETNVSALAPPSLPRPDNARGKDIVIARLKKELDEMHLKNKGLQNEIDLLTIGREDGDHGALQLQNTELRCEKQNLQTLYDNLESRVKQQEEELRVIRNDKARLLREASSHADEKAKFVFDTEVDEDQLLTAEQSDNLKEAITTVFWPNTKLFDEANFDDQPGVYQALLVCMQVKDATVQKSIRKTVRREFIDKINRRRWSVINCWMKIIEKHCKYGGSLYYF